MSADLNVYKKTDLLNVARKVGIHVVSKDTKKVLIDKLSEFIELNPHEALQALRSIETDLVSADKIETVDVTLKGDESDDDDEDDSDDDEEDDEEEVVEDVEEDDDAEDKDYNAGPPINLKQKLADPIIEYFELFVAKFLDCTDKVGITTLYYNDELREKLSTSITLNYLELLSEFSYFLYYYIPLIPIKHNRSIHQVFKDNIEFLSTSNFSVPDFSVLLEQANFSVLFSWILSAVLLPLLISYYVNFSRRVFVFDEEESIVARIYKFDPFIYALSKTLIFFFLVKNSGTLTTLDSYSGILSAAKNYILIQMGIYNQFATGLGNFPIIVGLSNVLIAIYSQFEDN